MPNTSITDLFKQWCNYLCSAWKYEQNTNKLNSGLMEIENTIAAQAPHNNMEAFLQLVFVHNLWWEGVGYYPLQGRNIILDSAFRSVLWYLRK